MKSELGRRSNANSQRSIGLRREVKSEREEARLPVGVRSIGLRREVKSERRASTLFFGSGSIGLRREVKSEQGSRC